MATKFGKKPLPAELNFTAGDIPSTTEYVVWIDTMGSRSAMLRSHAVASNFLAKMHAAAIHSELAIANLPGSKTIFPMSDGFFFLTDARQVVERFIGEYFNLVSKEFLGTNDPMKRFMIRGAIAYGSVSTGLDLSSRASKLQGNSSYAGKLVVGRPLTQAYLEEKNAAPFGLAIHESARSFAPKIDGPLSGVDYLWFWNSKIVSRDHGRTMLAAIKEHLKWCKVHSHSVLYKEVDIERHLSRAIDYFTAQKP